MSVELAYGKVAEVNDKGRVRVELEARDGILSPWLLVLYERTKGDQEYETLAIGEPVACLIDDHGETGVILGSVYSEDNPPPVTSAKVWIRQFADGTKLSYDKETKAILVDCKGPVTVQSAADVSVDCGAGKNVKLGGGSEELVKKSYLSALETRLDANETAIATAVNAAGPGGPAASAAMQISFTSSKTAYVTSKATATTTKTKGG